MEFESTVAMWAAIVGFLMPLVIAVINRRDWSSPAKGMSAFVACLVAAFGTAYFEGGLSDANDVVTAALVVFTMAITTFQFWWKPSGIADGIESRTG